MNSLDKAIQLCDGLSVLAEKIGVSPARLGNWRVRGVPVEHCLAIERATECKVTRKDLRPGDWQNIWPELAAGVRRATEPTPESTRAGRTPASPHNILDTVPERAVIAPPGDKA